MKVINILHSGKYNCRNYIQFDSQFNTHIHFLYLNSFFSNKKNIDSYQEEWYQKMIEVNIQNGLNPVAEVKASYILKQCRNT